MKNPISEERIPVVPGELRKRDVKVGRHVAISPDAVPRFLEHFERSYSGLGKADALVSLAASHHRLLWIHPFMDGNGRVARLMSHALLLDVLDTGGVWSVARGFSISSPAYKLKLQNCDSGRRGALDGRGNLSESALVDFTRYFLLTCIDQVEFMEGLLSPDKVRDRIQSWCRLQIEEKNLHKKSPALLDSVLFQGQVKRGEVEGILQVAPRTARRAVSDLLGAGILASDGVKSPLRIAFPAKLASEIMPGLFPSVREEGIRALLS